MEFGGFHVQERLPRYSETTRPPNKSECRNAAGIYRSSAAGEETDSGAGASLDCFASALANEHF